MLLQIPHWLFRGVRSERAISGLNHFAMQNDGDPYGNRTHVCGVRGRRLNRLTNGPHGTPSGTRTLDTLIKSQVLYQLS